MEDIHHARLHLLLYPSAACHFDEAKDGKACRQDESKPGPGTSIDAPVKHGGQVIDVLLVSLAANNL